MKSLLINPQDAEELQLIIKMLRKMGVAYHELTEDEKEDIGFGVMMKEADPNDQVSEEEVMDKLNQKKNEG